LPNDGFAVPIDKISSGFRVWGILPGYSHNDVSPQLVLYPQRMAVKVMQTSYHEYTALRRVDYQPEGFLRSAKVVLQFAGHTEYEISPSSVAITRDLLRFYHERGAPLTPAAHQEAQAG
jgi:hypothetical protein